ALRRGGEAEAEGGEACARGQGVRAAREMMALVEDDEAEARPEVLHVEVRGVVRRHCDGLDVVLAAADEADGDAEGGAQEVVPLADEVERRRDDECGAALVVDRHNGDVALSGTRRQYDDTAPARRAPRGQRLRLIRARRTLDLGSAGELRVFARAVVV